MFDSEIIIRSLRISSDKDSKAYKVTEYYTDLVDDHLMKVALFWLQLKY